MRQPIQRQLLGPMLAVVVLSSAATAVLAAWLGMRAARQGEQERLEQLAATLTDAGFPLTDSVLKRMSELSGADFVTLDEQGTVQHASREFGEADRGSIAKLPMTALMNTGGGDHPVQLAAGDFRAVRIPIKTSAATRPLSLVILTSDERWDDLAWRSAMPPLLAGLLAASIAALLAALISQRLVRRISALADRAAILSEGRFEPAPLPPVDDELRDLAAALNTTAEQLQQYEQQIRAGERLTTLGRLGAGMAHQLRNAITGARMALDLHAADLPAEFHRESLAVALRQLTLMESYLRRFLALGRGESPARRDVDLSVLIAEALQLVEPMCRHHGIAVTWQAPREPVLLTGDAEALRQMLLNLLTNAIEAVQPLPQAERKIGVELQSSEEGIIAVRIWDQGPGPSADIAQTLFDPFVTDKPDGTGLGLAVAKEIVRDHGGTIGWRREGGRTLFDVWLAKAAKPQTIGEG